MIGESWLQLKMSVGKNDKCWKQVQNGLKYLVNSNQTTVYLDKHYWQTVRKNSWKTCQISESRRRCSTKIHHSEKVINAIIKWINLHVIIFYHRLQRILLWTSSETIALITIIFHACVTLVTDRHSQSCFQ